MGVAPTEANRSQMFSSPERVPLVPDHIRSSKVGKGVGSAEPEGGEAYVFKSFFAPIDEYRNRLEALGLPTISDPSPTRADVARVFGEEDVLESGGSREETAKRREKAGDPAAGLMPGLVDENGNPLKGAAAAAAQSKMLAGMAPKG